MRNFNEDLKLERKYEPLARKFICEYLGITPDKLRFLGNLSKGIKDKYDYQIDKENDKSRIEVKQEIEKIHSIIGDKEKNHKEYKEKDNDDKNLFPAREKKEAEDIITHNGQFRKMPDGRIIDLEHNFKTTFKNIWF